MKTRKTTKSKQRMGWMPMFMLAILLAVPSCFEISCIKLTGCELFDDEVNHPERSPIDKLEGNSLSIETFIENIGLSVD